MSNPTQSSTPKSSKLTLKTGCLGCLGVSVVLVGGIFSLTMIGVSLSPYKVSCKGEGSISTNGYQDQKSADIAFKENTDKGMSCTTDYPKSASNSDATPKVESASNSDTTKNKELASSDSTALKLEGSKVATQITTALTDSKNFLVQSIQCPDEILAKADTTTDCDARLSPSADGKNLMRVIIPVTPTGKGSDFDYKLTKVFLLGKTLEVSSMEVFKADNPDSSPIVQCPDEMPAEVGQSYKCTITNGAQTGEVIVKPTNTTGSFERKITMGS